MSDSDPIEATTFSQQFRSPRVLGVVLFVMAMIPFIGSWSGPWLLDDLPLIVYNKNVTSSAGWYRLWTTDYWITTGAAMKLYRPLTMTTYAANWALSPTPSSFRIINGLLHGTVTVLFWLLFLNKGGNLLGFLIALVFAAHPVQCDSVSNITGRAEILVALFFLCAICALRKSLSANRSGLAILAFVAAILGMLFSKETGVMLALFPAIYLVTFRKIMFGRPVAQRGALIFVFLTVACVVLYLGARWKAVGSLPDRTGLYGISARLKLSGSAIAKSLELIVWPHEHRAVWAIPNLSTLSWTQSAIGLVCFIAAVSSSMVLIAKRHRAALPLSLFCLAMIPLTHVIPNVIWVWERGLYVPVMAASWFFFEITYCRGKLQRARPLAIAVIMTLLLIAELLTTARRSALYASEMRFWRHEFASDPRDTATRVAYSEILLKVGKTGEAVVMREEAHALQPQRGELLAPLAAAYTRAGFAERANNFLSTASLSRWSFQSSQTEHFMLKQLEDLSWKAGAADVANRFRSMRSPAPEPVNSGRQNK